MKKSMTLTTPLSESAMQKISAIFFLSLCFFHTSFVQEKTVIIHAGTLIAIPGEAALKHHSVVIEDGDIREVRAGYIAVHGSEYIELRCCFVLPGLIDLHVHLTSPVAAGGKLRVVTETSADLALTAAQFAKRTLEAGFTAVVDLGTGHRAHADAIFALRRATRSHKTTGRGSLPLVVPFLQPGYRALVRTALR